MARGRVLHPALSPLLFARIRSHRRASLTWCYRAALVRVPAMSGQAAEKPAHIEQKMLTRRGKGSGDGPRYAADRDATFQRWPSIRRKSGRCPSRGPFGSREAGSWSTGRVVRRFFARFPPLMTAWGIFPKRSTRSAQSKLGYSEKWQRTTRPVGHEVAGAWGMAGMRAGSRASSRLRVGRGRAIRLLRMGRGLGDSLCFAAPSPHAIPRPPSLGRNREDDRLGGVACGDGEARRASRAGRASTAGRIGSALC